MIGGVKPLRINGKITIRVKDVGDNKYTSRYLASVYGWHFGDHVVGQGDTVEMAVRDWCDCVKRNYEKVKETFDIVAE